MNTPEPTPENAPKPEETAPDAPSLAPFIKIAKAFFMKAPSEPSPPPAAAPPPRWIVIMAMLLRLVWPLAMFGGGIALFITFGATGWLWLVILLIIVCAIFARPPQTPTAS